MNHRRLLLCSFLVCFVLPCHPTTTRDIITSSGTGNGLLKDGETIVSAGKSFELGFFPPQGENSYGGRYVGIWYYERIPQTIVWVANRDNPCSDSPGTNIAIQDGKLTVSSGNGDSCFSVGHPHPSTPRSYNRTAQLLDSGNLVFRNESGAILWQSFDHPTDTFLPGMKMTPDLKLVSWKTSQDQPATGNYIFQLDKGATQYIISNEQSAEPFWWKSGDPLASSIVEEVTFLLSNFNRTDLSNKSCSNHRSLNFSCLSSFNDTTKYKDTRLLMNSSGEIQFYVWDNNENTWTLPWQVPQDNCSVYNFCGSFGICSRNNTQPCKCLDGYDPTYPNDWKAGRYSGGCSRKPGTSSSCNQTITFLNLTSMKVDYPYPSSNPKTEEQCRKECLVDCGCQAYSFGGEQRGEDGCRIWTAGLNDLQDDYDHGIKLSVRVADIEPQAQGSSSKRKEATAVLKSLAIYILAVVAFVLSCSLGCIVYKRKLAGNRREIILGMPNIGMQEQDLITEYDQRKIEVPFFSLGAILAATDNFSDANKLGQGGFGPVYKGDFPGGQTIAVKRLLSNCGQGVDEFKNEVMLIAKLQHRNLVKLLGYCITTNEKILLYEYMPKKSLDFIIFDRQLSVTLNWTRRFDIILGIARGLLYLHQDSRLRIIHRDLKVSNILLDEEMNPKISDFGLARIVEGKRTEANTNKVVGTFGYMSPEYALEGVFSIKSDVYSFGVVLLEIISGRRNMSLYQSQEALNLLRHTWKLWMEEMAVEIVDPVLLNSLSRSEILKCIHIGLLCVQEDPSDRPTMTDVVIMLVTESMALPRPNQPAFVARRRLSAISSSSSSSKPNEFTVTMLEGR